MKLSAVIVVVVALTCTVSAQWSYRDPTAPRTADGKVDVKAPAPRTAAGTVDLSGIWQTDGKYNFNLAADLKPEARQVLDQLAAALESDQLGSSSFMIEGHTDAVGAETYNQLLSEQRAQAVRQYLASKQVDPSRLQTVGKGEAELLDAADGAAAVNRRVRVINLGGG